MIRETNCGWCGQWCKETSDTVDFCSDDCEHLWNKHSCEQCGVISPTGRSFEFRETPETGKPEPMFVCEDCATEIEEWLKEDKEEAEWMWPAEPALTLEQATQIAYAGHLPPEAMRELVLRIRDNETTKGGPDGQDSAH